MIAAASLITAPKTQVLRSFVTSLTRPSYQSRPHQSLRSYKLSGQLSRFSTMSDGANTSLKRSADEAAVDIAEASSSKQPRLEAEGEPTIAPSTESTVESAPKSSEAGGAAMDVDAPASTAAEGSAEASTTTTNAKPKTKKERYPDRRNRPKNQNPPQDGEENIKGRDRGGRGRRTRDESPREPELDADGNPIPKAPKLPKRQCALMMGFCGSGYSGMQIQPDRSRTIEGVLFDALVKIGAVSQDNADNVTKVGLARAARTDAGVHAAGNVVSLKMILNIPGVEDIIARINEELPPEIRVWGYARTQNSFNARLICESRKYTYFFPTYLLIPPKPGSGMHKIWQQHAEKFLASTSTATTTDESTDPTSPTSPSTTTTTTADPTDPTSTSPSTDPASTTSPSSIPASDFWSQIPNPETSSKDEDLARKRAWRISSEQVANLRKLANRYVGTHNFHNFTVGREFKDRSNMRYMKKVEISDPVVYGETEWISVLWHGQSFMLHQRKMMAILVLAARMGTPPRIVSELYGQRDVFVPKMPSLGLLLEEPLFDSYNERMSAINANLQPTDPEYRPLIDWNVHREKMDAFKEVFIYKNMREVEDRDGLFDAWIRTIDAYAGNDLLYLNPTGAVPEEAVIKQGERRPNPFREKRVFDTTSFPAAGIKSKLEAEEAELEDADEDEKLDKRHLEETEG